MTYTSVNPVSVGGKTLKTHYDDAFNNSVDSNDRLDVMDRTIDRLWLYSAVADFGQMADGTTTDTLLCVASAGSKIMVGTENSGSTGADYGVVYSSDYGRSWTKIASTISSLSSVYGLAVDNSGSTWVAVGFPQVSSEIAYSTNNGSTWTSVATSANVMQAVCYSGTLFCAVGEGYIYTSPDGVTWTSRTAAGTPANISFYGVCWSSGLDLFIAVGSDTTGGTHAEIQTSPDGITWTARTAVGTDTLRGVAQGESLDETCVIYAVGNNGMIQYSLNGTTGWTQITTGGSSLTDFNSVAGTPTGAIAVGEYASVHLIANLQYTTPLTHITSDTSHHLKGVTYTSDMGIIIVGGLGYVFTSLRYNI